MNKDHSGRTGALSRRTVLAIAGAAALVRPTLGRAQAGEPIKLGIVFPKQGTFAELGGGAANAATLVLEQAGSILGRPARAIWLDDPNPQSAQQNMQKLIDEEKVTAVIGGASGATSLALSSLAKRQKIPFITISGAASLTGKDCHRYTFRAMLPAPVAVKAMSDVLLARGKKWYFLMPDYVYGQDVYTAYKAALDKAGGTQVGYDKMPLGTTDFSSFILKIRAAKPDQVITALSGNELPNFLKQYAELGMQKGPIVSSPIVTDTDITGAGPQASGIYGKIWDYKDPRNSPDDVAFTDAYTRKYGKPPHANAYLAGLSMRMLLAAIAKAGSTDAAAIVRALETVRFTDGEYPIYFREWDHQLIHRTLVLKVRDTITDPLNPLEVAQYLPGTPAGLDELYGLRADSACSIGEI